MYATTCRMGPNPPVIPRHLATSQAGNITERSRKPGRLNSTADTVGKQQVAGSIPAGSVRPERASRSRGFSCA